LKIIQCPDGNPAVSGYTNFGYYLIKLDKQGNLLWSKTYKQDNQAFDISSFTSTSDNGFILAGNFGRFTDATVGVIRTNSTGDVLWNRGFYKHSSVGTLQNEFDVMQQGNEILVTTPIWQTEPPAPDTLNGVLIKLNNLDGATIWTKKISVNGKPVNIRDIHPYGNDLLLNIDGNGNVFSAPNNSFTIMNHNANILKSSTLVLGDINYPISITNAIPMDNGDIYFLDGGTETLQSQPLYAYHSFFIKMDKNNNIKWSKSYGSRGRGRYFYGVLGPNRTFAALGDEAGSSYAQYGYLSDQFMLLKIDSSGGSIGSSCELFNTKVSVIPNISGFKILLLE
jgi:hypothetical protein